MRSVEAAAGRPTWSGRQRTRGRLRMLAAAAGLAMAAGLAAACPPSDAAAEPGPPRAVPGPQAPSAEARPPRQGGAGEALSVYLLTIGPGDRVWERFGHNALLVRDSLTGTSAVYNWGIFDFDQENFFPRFISGRMRYRLGRTTLGRLVAAYRRANRPVRARRVRLTPPQRRRLRRLARINYRPENRFYAYDPYLDNCSTRIRDLLDRVLEGRIRRASVWRWPASCCRRCRASTR